MGKAFLLLPFVYLNLCTFTSAWASVACEEYFTKKTLQKIDVRRLSNVEVAFQFLEGYNESVTPVFQGWTRYADETPHAGRATYNGKPVVIRNLENDLGTEVKNLNEPAMLRRINAIGLGPKLVGVFSKYGEKWIATEWISGDYKKFEMELPEVVDLNYINLWNYGPSPRANALIGIVNQRTIVEVREAFEKLSEINIVANDFQFLVASDGSIKIVNTRFYEYSSNARERNERIQSFVLEQLRTLVDGQRVYTPAERWGVIY